MSSEAFENAWLLTKNEPYAPPQSHAFTPTDYSRAFNIYNVSDNGRKLQAYTRMFIYNKLAEMVEGIAQTLDFENALAETGYEPRSLKPSADGMSHEYGNFLATAERIENEIAGKLLEEADKAQGAFKSIQATSFINEIPYEGGMNLYNRMQYEGKLP